mmetsp:Transcript_54088/g.174723  ORF Transcript_54088/g.174723 Transcript_54088/m.174723 type:complete len:237 (+) Transcript_54088:134-844(+)
MATAAARARRMPRNAQTGNRSKLVDECSSVPAECCHGSYGTPSSEAQLLTATMLPKLLLTLLLYSIISRFVRPDHDDVLRYPRPQWSSSRPVGKLWFCCKLVVAARCWPKRPPQLCNSATVVRNSSRPLGTAVNGPGRRPAPLNAKLVQLADRALDCPPCARLLVGDDWADEVSDLAQERLRPKELSGCGDLYVIAANVISRAMVMACGGRERGGPSSTNEARCKRPLVERMARLK